MLYRDGYMSVGIAESADLSRRPTMGFEHSDNVIDQALWRYIRDRLGSGEQVSHLGWFPW